MPLSFNPPPIDQHLRQTIREIGGFLTDNPSDGAYYKMLYLKIDKLTIKAKTEGWLGYEHRNPYKTLADFLKNGNIPELVIKYYSIPTLGKKLVKQTKTEKITTRGKRFIEWITDQISKFKPDIRLK